MKLTRTIAFRLFLLLALVQTIILFGLAYATMSVQQSSLMEHMRLSALRLSDVLARSMRYSMMLNRKEDLHEIVASVGREPGIVDIRVYNKSGEVVFGTQPGDLGKRVDMNAEACVSCHKGNGLDAPPANGEQLSRIFSLPGGQRVLGLITPIRNEPECANAACHAHPAEKTILGVLDVKMGLGQIDQRLDESRNRLLLISLLAVVATGIASGIFIWLVVRRPVKKLTLGMEMVADGHLDHRLEGGGRNELGQLARSFNRMTEDLSAARHELTEWSRTLEQKVTDKTADLERAHREMLRVEKLASLGNLASSVAHELNNPLEGILTFARLLIKRIRKTALPPEEIESYSSDLRLVADEAQRCGEIVKNLLVFARQKGGSFQETHLAGLIDRCVRLVGHHAQMRNVKLTSSVTAADACMCDPNQIEQVLLALLVNAIDAMGGNVARPEGGVVHLAVGAEAGNMVLRVSDNGIGMSEEIAAHVFEPFFTTKSEGKGVGLGLAIVYGIIQRHRGAIDVDSRPGRGTTFTITLPLTHESEPLEQSPLTA
jgi:two-component system, NtrC family, sensor kinase